MPAEKSAEMLKLFKCDQCDHTCSCKEAMRKHAKEVHKEVTTQGVPPIPIKKSFQCDQCDYETASDKGLKQHKRLKLRISQLDGNTSDLDDCGSLLGESKHEAINEECFEALGTTKVCVISCQKVFKTEKDGYKHMFLSTSQYCQRLHSNLEKNGFK